MNSSLSFQSLYHSTLTEDKQQTNVRSSLVTKDISLQRFDPWFFRPFAFWYSGTARLTVSMNQRYGSPVSIRTVRIRSHNSRAETTSTTSLVFGLIKGNRSSSISCSLVKPAPCNDSFSMRYMKSSVTLIPWCKLGHLRFGSPPVGLRISRKSIISGWLILR